MSISSFDSARQRARSSDILKGSTAAVCGFDIFINKAPCFHTCCNDQLSVMAPLPKQKMKKESPSHASRWKMSIGLTLRCIYLFPHSSLQTAEPFGGSAGPGRWAMWRRRSLAAQSDEATRVLCCCCCFCWVLIWMLGIVFWPPLGKQRVSWVYQKMFSEAGHRLLPPPPNFEFGVTFCANCRRRPQGSQRRTSKLR